MIISNLIGGLGNQMFQYALGRALSLKLNSPFFLDISDYANYELHQGFELKRIFNCTTDIASKENVRRILGWQVSTLVHRLLLRPSMAAFRCESFVVEPYFNYWTGINHLTSNCYLYGYWQSEKYFSDVATQIREDFTFKLQLSKKNAALVKQMNPVNAVSLHVRRGDYANHPKTTATHGLCSLEYYQAAIQYIAEQIKDPHFFVFSDDIAWVKTNVKLNFPHQFVEHNHGEESYNDMRLMSLCKHNIIANSSFSWWGAWLNQNSEKIVIAPKQWFSKSTDTSDLIPAGWVRL